MRRIMLWLLAAIVSMTIAGVAFFPAARLVPIVEAQTEGRFTLGDPQGTIWSGSAFLGASAGDRDPITPAVPGRFSWNVSPLLLLGRVDVQMENPDALENPLHIKGSWRTGRVGPGALMLPAERLAALGAPLNTLAPSGQMRLSWNEIQLSRNDKQIDVNGLVTLDLIQITSRLSPINPLGTYRVTMNWIGQQAPLQLMTVSGPLVLEGRGTTGQGQFRFSGTARAESAQDARLNNMLGLLGQRRQQDGKEVIDLNFER